MTQQREICDPLSVLNLTSAGSRILPLPSKIVGGADAPLRILLPRLQEGIFESPVNSRLRRARSFVPTLRQQGSGAVLVRLLRPHFEKKRVALARATTS